MRLKLGTQSEEIDGLPGGKMEKRTRYGNKRSENVSSKNSTALENIPRFVKRTQDMEG